jgi:hypothetical protein
MWQFFLPLSKETVVCDEGGGNIFFIWWRIYPRVGIILVLLIFPILFSPHISWENGFVYSADSIAASYCLTKRGISSLYSFNSGVKEFSVGVCGGGIRRVNAKKLYDYRNYVEYFFQHFHFAFHN